MPEPAPPTCVAVSSDTIVDLGAEARLGGGGEMPRLVVKGTFETGGSTTALPDEDDSTPSISVALPFITMLAFFADARLGGGGDMPCLDLFDRVGMGEAAVGRPRNGGGERSVCTTEAWSVILLVAGFGCMPLQGGNDLAVGMGGTLSADVNGELCGVFEGTRGKRLCTPVGV